MLFSWLVCYSDAFSSLSFELSAAVLLSRLFCWRRLWRHWSFLWLCFLANCLVDARCDITGFFSKVLKMAFEIAEKPHGYTYDILCRFCLLIHVVCIKYLYLVALLMPPTPWVLLRYFYFTLLKKLDEQNISLKPKALVNQNVKVFSPTDGRKSLGSRKMDFLQTMGKRWKVARKNLMKKISV